MQNQLEKRIKKNNCIFKNTLNFNVANILFPHTWQRQIHGRKRSIIGIEMALICAQILKRVAKFLIATKRFNNDCGIRIQSNYGI